jgi:hypothetical protein
MDSAAVSEPATATASDCPRAGDASALDDGPRALLAGVHDVVGAELASAQQTRNERQRRASGPFAAGGVRAGVAGTRRLDPDQNLLRAGFGNRDVLHHDRGVESVNDGGTHQVGPRCSLKILLTVSRSRGRAIRRGPQIDA